MPTAQGDPMPPNHHHDNDELHDHDLGLSHDLPDPAQPAPRARPAHGRRPRGGAGGVQLRRNEHRHGLVEQQYSSLHGRRGRHRDPRGDRRPLPGRRLERRERADRERHRPQRHHQQLRRRLRRRPRRAADDHAQGARHRQRLRAARGGRRLPLALRPERALLALLRRRDRRELPARRAGGRCGRHRHLHQHLSRPPTPAAGRTSTSRSTRASPTPPGPAASCATSQVALPEEPSKLVYATDGYDASLGNLAQTSLQTDMVFSDGWSLQLGKVTGDVDTGMTVASTCRSDQSSISRPGAPPSCPPACRRGR